LIEELLNEVTPLTRVDVSEVMRWQGIALTELGRYNEAYQFLTEACSLARKLDAQPELWCELANLAEVSAKLGNYQEANANRVAARAIIRQIAESLYEVGLSESFLNQPRVQKMMRA
jgi:tetratricopeptide (TPR) repeat protein